MGTRSLTKVITTWEDTKGKKQRKPITCMYRQYDGYLRGHGNDLAEFLQPFTIVNGIGLTEEKKIANGMDCLAAQMIAHFKDGPGNIYLMHPDTDDCGEEYIYEVNMNEGGELIITCHDVYNKAVIFWGSSTELIEKVLNILDDNDMLINSIIE